MSSSVCVDEIWTSMKNDANLSQKLMDGPSLWSMPSICSTQMGIGKSKKKRSSKSKEKIVKTDRPKTNNVSTESFFITPVKRESSNSPASEEKRGPNADTTKKNIDRVGDHFLKSIAFLTEDSTTVRAAAVYDSDDDSEDDVEAEGEDSPSVQTNLQWSCRIERLVGNLQSEESKIRLSALATLKITIETLLPRLPQTAAPLDFPPPFNESRIILTHKRDGAVVSDMASALHVPQWATWQRTHETISSQFPERQKDTVGSPKTNENDALDAHNNTPSTTVVPSGTSSDKDREPARKQLQAILNCCGTSLFRRFGDPLEKCRRLAL
eukprot:9625075-Ditylum_brightwellii.AAC.1